MRNARRARLALLLITVALPTALPIAAPSVAADSAAVVAKLPSALEGTSAIWDGTDAYIFGGEDASSSRISGSMDWARAALASRNDAQRIIANSQQQNVFEIERSNLEVAQELLEIIGGPGESLATAAAVAKAGSLHQLHILGTKTVAIQPPIHASPSQAALELLARHGVVPTPEELIKVLSLDAIPEPQGGALRNLMDAFLGFETTTRDAFANVDMDKLRAWARLAEDPSVAQMTPTDRPLLAESGINFGPVIDARSRFTEAALELISALEPNAITLMAAPTIDLCPAFAIDLDGLDTTYSQGCALVLDVGGDDTYLNNAGGSNILSANSNPSCDLTTEGGAGALVDLAGSDLYGSPSGRLNCGINGGGFLGAGFLMDVGGNDAYVGGDQAINGAGVLGIGFLLDASGTDAYDSQGTGTNGGGVIGVGHLVDAGGNDAYQGFFGTNGGAFLGGLGFVFDAGGDDNYTSQGFGTNGGATTGVGFLLDAGGDDEYRGGDFGINGGSDFGGAGFLFDAKGNDVYQAGNQGTNGGADHGTNVAGDSGMGLLFDGGGNDTYSGGDFGTNGGGSFSAGFLFDAGGTDAYVAGSFGTNGGGNFGGSGFLLDAAGNDQYNAGSVGTNGGSENGAGFLFDAGGNDTYTAGNRGANGGGNTGSGFLFDGNGMDAYADQEGGTGIDRTVVPKGFSGAQVDSALIPSVPKLRDNPDGTCTVFDDLDGDDAVDSGEVIATAPCPDPKVRLNSDGSITLYDDKNDDDIVDPGEALVTTPATADQDGDGVPDSLEDDLCAQENPNFNFEGTCVGNDYSPPTVAGIIEDVEKFLP